MAKRVFEAKVRVVVDNAKVRTPKRMRLSLEQLQAYLHEIAELNVHPEDAELDLGNDNSLASVEIDWASLKEVK